MHTILVIDDHQDFREDVVGMLMAEDYDVMEASCPDEAFKLLKNEIPDVIICDLHMPFKMDEQIYDFQYSYEVGMRTISELSWAIPHVPIIVTSSAVPHDIQERTKDLNAIAALSKPFRPNDLLQLVSSILTPERPVVMN